MKKSREDRNSETVVGISNPRIDIVGIERSRDFYLRRSECVGTIFFHVLALSVRIKGSRNQPRDQDDFLLQQSRESQGMVIR